MAVDAAVVARTVQELRTMLPQAGELLAVWQRVVDATRTVVGVDGAGLTLAHEDGSQAGHLRDGVVQHRRPPDGPRRPDDRRPLHGHRLRPAGGGGRPHGSVPEADRRPLGRVVDSRVGDEMVTTNRRDLARLKALAEEQTGIR
jgi:hypothetical protein